MASKMAQIRGKISQSFRSRVKSFPPSIKYTIQYNYTVPPVKNKGKFKFRKGKFIFLVSFSFIFDQGGENMKYGDEVVERSHKNVMYWESSR